MLLRRIPCFVILWPCQAGISWSLETAGVKGQITESAILSLFVVWMCYILCLLYLVKLPSSMVTHSLRDSLTNYGLNMCFFVHNFPFSDVCSWKRKLPTFFSPYVAFMFSLWIRKLNLLEYWIWRIPSGGKLVKKA